MEHNPDWTFLFWRTGMPGTNAPLGMPYVDQLLADRRYSPVVKSDVLRFAALMMFGGIYVDTDFECFRSLNDLPQSETGFFCAYGPRFSWQRTYDIIGTAILGAVPGHPVTRDVLNEMLRRIVLTPIDRCNGPTHNGATDPETVTAILSGRSDVSLFPSELFFPEAAPDMIAIRDRIEAKQAIRLADRGAFGQHHWNQNKFGMAKPESG